MDRRRFLKIIGTGAAVCVATGENVFGKYHEKRVWFDKNTFTINVVGGYKNDVCTFEDIKKAVGHAGLKTRIVRDYINKFEPFDFFEIDGRRDFGLYAENCTIEFDNSFKLFCADENQNQVPLSGDKEGPCGR